MGCGRHGTSVEAGAGGDITFVLLAHAREVNILDPDGQGFQRALSVRISG